MCTGKLVQRDMGLKMVVCWDRIGCTAKRGVLHGRKIPTRTAGYLRKRAHVIDVL